MVPRGCSKLSCLVLVAACGSVKATEDGSVGDVGDDDAPFANVDGTVLDFFGSPLAGANVRIGTTTFTTGGDGQFHFTAVPPTYDLDVVTTDPNNLKRVTGFRGLTKRTLEVDVFASGVQTTQVSGSFTGVAFPLPAGQHIALSDTEEYFGFDQPTMPGGEDITAPNFSGATGVWFGKPTFQGTIWALQFTRTGNTTTAYNGFSRIPASMTAGTPKVVAGIAMTALSTATLSGNVTGVPVGGTASVAIALKHASDPFGHFVGESTNTAGAFSLPSPSGGSISVNVVATAGATSGGIMQSYNVWKANVPSNATNVSLAFGTAAAYGGPANGATGVKNDATFTWSAGAPAGVYLIDINCGANATYAASIFTTGTSVKLSDTSALGATWPLTTSCTWSITLYGVVTTIDDVVAANARNKMDRLNGPVDGARTLTTGFGFTTE